MESPAAADAGRRVWLAAGKLHPLVVHFPIALLVVAGVFEFVRLRRGVNTPSTGSVVCLVLGAMGAVAAAALGWSSAESSGYGGSTAWILTTHRWAGVTTAVLAVFACGAAGAAKLGNDPRLLNGYRIAMVFAMISVSVAGHFGGSLVHGETLIQDAVAQALGREPATPGGGGVTLAGGGGTGAAAEFARDIEPILVKRCLQCHSGEKPEGGLNLSSRDLALKGGKSGHASVVPGDAGKSLLYQLVSGADPKRRMPPKGGVLPDEQIAAIKSWIDHGATWTGTHAPGEHWHWAYRAPVRSNPPAVQDTSWARNPIDQFILVRIESEGLKPSPEADRATLLRRLSLDLTGLPPSPEELDAFLADRRAGAYERAVDRQLASPHFGERWARPWLDLARYADSHGYEKDGLRVMWPYRDWVINAFNADMPFDEFTIDQLAGDLLPNPTGPQMVATGFHRNTQTNEEGGTDIEEFRVDAVIDRTNTTGSVWLGSTVGCAQCHNHKNDPLTQKEYYQLLAIFNQDALDVRVINSSEKYAAGAMTDYPRDGAFDELATANARIGELERVMATPTPALESEQAAWEARQAQVVGGWSIARAVKASAESGATLTPQDDGSLLAGGAAADKDVYTIDIDVPAGTRALRLETLTDPSQPKAGPGRSVNSNFVLTGFSAGALDAQGTVERPLAISTSRADFHQHEGGNGRDFVIADALDDNPRTGWAVGGQNQQSHAAVLVLTEPVAQATRVRVVLRQEYGEAHCIGRPRLSVSSLPAEDALAVAGVPAAVGEVVMIPAAQRTAEQKAVMWEQFRAVAPSLEPTRRELAAAHEKRSGLIVAQALVMQRSAEPRETHLFQRGSFLSPGEKVEPGTPSYLPPLPKDEPANRLTFARWLVSPQNPLTARVTVNRLWEGVMGKGLVETSEDFGPQGDAPTHPELLDWLATELVRNQWSIKQTLREIVTSSTYRQSSRVTPELLAKDPYNKLYARAPRFRVDAETIRDVALATSGLLTPTIGGPSVFPPQPDGTWTQIYSGAQWMTATGADRYRRGLYTFWRRTSPYPSFVTFDSPSREISCARRPKTNTPLQALTTLNDPAFVEAAAALARRMMNDGGTTPAARAAYGMRLCVTREPTAAEVSRLVALYEQQVAAYSQDAGSAKDMAGFGVAGAGGEYDPAEVSAWTVVANVMLNLDETITRQ